jgi:hypothetical protein
LVDYELYRVFLWLLGELRRSMVENSDTKDRVWLLSCCRECSSEQEKNNAPAEECGFRFHSHVESPKQTKNQD